MSLLVGLLLLCLSWTPTCSELIDSNDLVYRLFFIDRQDSARMQQLMEIYTNNGVLDGAKYDEELKRTYPRLHKAMIAFRRIYREIDEADKSASHFIDALLLTARQAREQEISRELESETILENFNALPESTKDYLITKFHLLKYLKYSDSSSTGKPPRGLETSTPSKPSVTKTLGTSTSSEPSTTKVSSTSSTMVTLTTSQRLSIAEIKKLLEPAIKDLRDSKGKFKSITFDFSPIENLFKKFLENPFSWSHKDHEKAFKQFKELAKGLSGFCYETVSEECEAASKTLASTLKQFIKTVAGLYPSNPKLKYLSSAYSSDISAASSSDQRLKIVSKYADFKLF